MPKRNRKQQIKSNIGRGRKAPRNEPNRGNRGGGGRGGQNSLTTPYTPRQARKVAKAGARAEYAPVIRGAKANIRASRNREQEVADWFDQLGGQIQQTAAATDASYGAANAAMQANINAAQQAAAQNQSNVAAQDAQFAAVTGADPGAFGKTAQTMNAGAEQRAIAQSALAAPIAAAGASQASYLRNTGVNASREGIQQKLLEGKRRRQIKQDLTAARKERAQKAQANFHDIRTGEQEYGIQLRAFPEAKAERRQAAREAARDRAQSERQDIRANQDSGGGEAGGGGRTPTQVRSDRREVKNARITAGNLYQAAKNKPKTASEWAAFTQLIISEGVEPWAAKKAVAKLKRRTAGRRKAETEGNRGIPGATQTPYAP